MWIHSRINGHVQPSAAVKLAGMEIVQNAKLDAGNPKCVELVANV
jgi:hypothetical protein